MKLFRCFLLFPIFINSRFISSETINWNFLDELLNKTLQNVDKSPGKIKSNLQLATIVQNASFSFQKFISTLQQAHLLASKMKMAFHKKVLNLSDECTNDLIYQIDSIVKYANDYNNLESCYNNSTWRPNYDDPEVRNCLQNIDEKLLRTQWALEVFDSFGKISSGLFKGNSWINGNYEQCSKISIEKSNSNLKWKGIFSRLNIVYFDDFTANFLRKTGMTNKNYTNNNSIEFNDSEETNQNRSCSKYGILKIDTCFPDTCCKEDIENLFKLVFNLPQDKYESLQQNTNNIICNIKSERHSGLHFFDDKAALGALLLFMVILGFIIFGSCYDLYLNTKAMVENNLNDKALFLKIMLTFSIYSNFRNIFSTENPKKSGQINCLHGIRAITMTWIVFAHSCSWSMQFIENTMLPFEMTKRFWNQFILNGSLSVDSFYTISSLLVVFLWMKETKKNFGKNVSNVKTWLLWILHRYLRLSPAYACVMVFDISLLRYLNDGPFWNYDGMEYPGCKVTWWTNLLYINNFLGRDDQCMAWTWYLATDMQFYVLSPPLLILLWKSEKIGIILISVLFFTMSFIRAGIIILIHPDNFPPIFIVVNDMNTQMKIVDDFWLKVYTMPYCRCGPYLLGFLLGYFLYKMESFSINLKLSKKISVSGWILAFGLGFGSLFGLHDYSKTNQIGLLYKMMYAAFGRSAWSLFICWVIFACFTGNGSFIDKILSWKGWLPLSRLAYCTYLIHPLVIWTFFSSQAKSINFGMQEYVFNFFANMIVSLVVALLFSLACEIPIMKIQKGFFAEKRCQKISNLNQKDAKNLKLEKIEDFSRYSTENPLKKVEKF